MIFSGLIVKIAGRMKKLQPVMHRIAVIYFIYMTIRNYRAKKARKEAAQS